MTAPGDFCDEGYFCTSGADTATFEICTAGSYCVLGSVDPAACPRGTYSNALGLIEVDQCGNCTSGFYCPQEGE